MVSLKTLEEIPFAPGSRIFVRVDLNVPMQNGVITDYTRIDSLMRTINYLKARHAKIILLSHFGRPKGTYRPEMSLKPIAEALEHRFNFSVKFAADCIGDVASDAVNSLNTTEVLVFENLRFHPGEEKNDQEFARQLSINGDILISDAFSCAHRQHASVDALTRLLPSCAGPNMLAELDALTSILETQTKPTAALIGGSKVSTKIGVLRNLIPKVDILVIGGGMANTFLSAQSLSVGRSLCEHDLIDVARTVLDAAVDAQCQIILPVDAVVAQEVKPHAPHKVELVNAISPDSMILDIGPKSIEAIKTALSPCKTILWNGPLGVFEVPPFNKGTLSIAQHVAHLSSWQKCTSVAGGGDTIAALSQANCVDQFNYISSAGGAFLEWLEGKTLPGIAALQES